MTLDTFPKLLQQHVQQRPTRDAIREKDLGIWQSWTWAEAAAEIRALACGLASLGLGRGDKLAIIGDNRPRLYWGMTAAQALGAVPVPLYQDSVADEMAYVLDNADVKIALVEDQEQVDKMLEVRERCPKIEHVIYDDPRGLRYYEHDFLHDFEKVQQLGVDFDGNSLELLDYVTNVGTFRLTREGLLLTGVMPGIDVRHDILDVSAARILLPPDGAVPQLPMAVVTGKAFVLQWSDQTGGL